MIWISESLPAIGCGWWEAASIARLILLRLMMLVWRLPRSCSCWFAFYMTFLNIWAKCPLLSSAVLHHTITTGLQDAQLLDASPLLPRQKRSTAVSLPPQTMTFLFISPPSNQTASWGRPVERMLGQSCVVSCLHDISWRWLSHFNLSAGRVTIASTYRRGKRRRRRTHGQLISLVFETNLLYYINYTVPPNHSCSVIMLLSNSSSRLQPHTMPSPLPAIFPVSFFSLFSPTLLYR